MLILNVAMNANPNATTINFLILKPPLKMIAISLELVQLVQKTNCVTTERLPLHHQTYPDVFV